jgi:tetratricopeptide (TPR) repeat protein
MESEKLNRAIRLIKLGNKPAALLILKEIVQSEPNNETAWLWLYSCVEKYEQKKYCLQQALRINPKNQHARTALLKLDHSTPSLEQSPPPQIVPTSPISSAQNKVILKSPLKIKEKSSPSGINLITGVLLLVTILLSCGIILALAKAGVLSLPSSILPIPSATSQSLEKRYADSVNPALESLLEWQYEYADFQALLIEPTEPSGASRLTILEFYNIAAQIYLDRDSYIQAGFAPLDDIVASSTELIDEGYRILNVINVITPVYEVEAAHTQIVKCIQLRISIMEELSTAILALRSVNLNQINNTRDCDTFDAAVEKLGSFVESYK